MASKRRSEDNKGRKKPKPCRSIPKYIKLRVDNKTIEDAEDFTYLGSKISTTRVEQQNGRAAFVALKDV